MNFNSDAGFGNGVGWSDGPNTYKNPYAQGGPLFGQGYGDRRHVLQAGVDYPFPQPQPAVNWNAPPEQSSQNAPGVPAAGDLRAVGRAIQSAQGQLANQSSGMPAAPSGNLPTYTSGIDAGPVWGQPQMTAAGNAIANQRTYVPNSISGVGVAGDTGRLMSDLAMGNGSTDALAFLRAGAKTNADQLFNSQNARANSGVQGGNWLAGLNATNLANQAARNSSIMGIISSLLGSM